MWNIKARAATRAELSERLSQQGFHLDPVRPLHESGRKVVAYDGKQLQGRDGEVLSGQFC